MRLLFKRVEDRIGRVRHRYAVRFADGREAFVAPQVAMAIYGLMAFPRLTDATLIELLWPDPNAMPDSWLKALRNTQWLARQVLARGGVAMTGHWRRDGWRLAPRVSGGPSPPRAMASTSAKTVVRDAFPAAECYRIGSSPRAQYKVLLTPRSPHHAAVGGSAARAWALAARELRLGAP